MTVPLEPGDLATIGVVFIEERAGRALVRLPNGSKTSVDHGALRRVEGPVHLTEDPATSEALAWCRRCDWVGRRPTRVEVEDAYLEHARAAHPPSGGERSV